MSFTFNVSLYEDCLCCPCCDCSCDEDRPDWERVYLVREFGSDEMAAREFAVASHAWARSAGMFLEVEVHRVGPLGGDRGRWCPAWMTVTDYV